MEGGNLSEQSNVFGLVMGPVLKNRSGSHSFLLLGSGEAGHQASEKGALVDVSVCKHWWILPSGSLDRESLRTLLRSTLEILFQINMSSTRLSPDNQVFLGMLSISLSTTALCE